MKPGPAPDRARPRTIAEWYAEAEREIDEEFAQRARARANRAHVRALLAERQPGYAAALEIMVCTVVV